MDERVGILTLQYPTLNRNNARRLLASDPEDSIIVRMDRVWRQVLKGGVVDMLPPGKYDRVVVATNGSESLRPLDRVVAQANLQERLTAELRGAGMHPTLVGETASMMRHFVSPNLVYSPEETRQRQELIRSSIVTTREFWKDERIIDRGVRVTPQQELFLQELGKQILARGGGDLPAGQVTRFLSRVLLLALALGLFAWFGFIHFPELFQSVRSTIALTVILALFLFGAGFAIDKTGLGPFAVPMILLSLLSTVLLRDRVGYNVTTPCWQ